MPNSELTKAIWEIEDAQRSCAQALRKGRAQQYPFCLAHAGAAFRLRNGWPIFERVRPGFEGPIGAETRGKNPHSSISFRSLVELHAGRINTPGSPYLEGVNPDGGRGGVCQHAPQ